ncbi:hypothetical protein PHYBOEH_005675 [Phytophthora boehmeriae]|uniref:SAM domain-containing protein n=1 Tax=Phytophthora boehmeriae TaxID=109152 RepID=A0A8T1X7I2_9STRA|nr:hypothetical protein PHYBOEH_005675 [Phytophthora boehmeriae]
MRRQQHGQIQILRENVPVVDLDKEPRTSRSWAWVCAALVSRDKGECAIRVVESVFVDKQQIWSWYCTDNGAVRRKARSKLVPELVHRAFMQFAAETPAVDPMQPIAVCWFEKNDTPGSVPFLTAQELWNLLHSLGSSSICSAVVSTFVRPRGELDPICYASLEHEFTLQKTGRAQGKPFWLALGGQRIASKDVKLNASVNEIVQHLVGFVEKNKKCRVVKCVSLFIMDESGRLHLWRTSACETISAATALASAPTFTDALASPFPISYDGPRAMNERLIARARAENARVPDERLIDAILASPAPHNHRVSTRLLSTVSSSLSSLNSRLDPLSDFENSRRANLDLRSSCDWDEVLSFLPPTSSLSRGRRRSMAGAHLMSSQKRGCCGDYCTMSTAELTASRLERKKETSLREQAGHARKGQRLTNISSATAAANAFMESRRTDDLLGRLTGQRKPSSPQRQQHAETQALHSLQPTHTIPFKLVAQTRAEKKLVDLFIRRYQNGEDGDYLAEAYYGDGEPLGVTFPGYYYRDAQVCANCYEFYMLVEKVRMKALEQISRNVAHKASSSHRNSNKQNTNGDGSRRRRIQQFSMAERGEEEDDDDDNNKEKEPENVDGLQHVWERVWAHTSNVTAAITKKDAAELYSFVKPHPAVAMVLGALGALLLGSNGSDWGEVKRLISQDKLVSRLNRVDLDALSERAVLQAAAHARNPLFTPEHIAPISTCAARFCDWVRTVLQAYAWKQRLHMEDVETCRMLCFLKPELLPAGVVDTQQELGKRENGRSYEAEITRTSKGVPNAKVRRETQHKQVAHRAIQAQQMSRLAAPTGLRDGVGGTTETVFTCQDGVTQIPYVVIGQPIGESAKCNLVVFHDLFDTLESTRVFFRAIVARNVGARALLFNFPGQSGTTYAVDDQASEEDKIVMNNMWLARRVHELFNYLQHTAQFVTTGAPFHIVGFGNGANVAACYGVLHGKSYDGYLQSIALFNGFASVDAQLAAILHSAVNVFTCLPPTRPDLPVSFFCKFLFSEAYLRKVDMNLALSIYTAVTNAITLDGRIRLCRGALRHMDLGSQLVEIDAPIVLVQSVENALVAPTNVDPFLQGRANVQHVWSHQQSHTSELRSKTRTQLRKALATPKSAFVSWLRAGHELRQEAKHYVTEVIEVLVNCLAEPPEQAQDAEQEKEEHREESMPKSHTSVANVESSAKQVSAKESTPDSKGISKFLVAAVPGSSLSVTQTLVAESKSPAAANTRSPPLNKSPYELQLEKSDRAFQEAMQKHEEQKSAYEKKKQLQQQQKERLGDDFVKQTAAVPPPVKADLPVSYQIVPVSKTLPPAIPPLILQQQANGSDGLRNPEEDEDDNGALVDSAIDNVRAKIQAEEERLEKEAEQQRQKQRAATEERMAALREEQERRRREWEQEDRERLAALEAQLQEQQAARLASLHQRELEQLTKDELVIAARSTEAPQSSSIPTLEESVELPSISVESPFKLLSSSILLAPSLEETRQKVRDEPELPSMFDQLEAEEQARKRKHKQRRGLGPGALAGSSMTGEQYDQVRDSLHDDFLDDTRANESNMKRELRRRRDAQATRVQKYIRRFLATRRVDGIRREMQQQRVKRFAGGEIVRIARGHLGRRRFTQLVDEKEKNARRLHAATRIQATFRGYSNRIAYRVKLRESKVRMLQRVFRGHRGRKRARRLRIEQNQRRFQDRNAAKLQATWRMYIARGKFLTARFSELAALEIQRMYRGHVGRREAARKKQWRDAPPGAERLALGLQLIEGSKQAFERQQSELDALHRAQEAAERQVSTVHNELREAEKELAILEHELQEIDQLDADVRELTHEAERLHAGGVEGLLRNHHSSSTHNQQPLGNGVPEMASSADNDDVVPYELGAENAFESKEALKKRQADAYAVEMALSIKRGEREKKKRDLEAEFASAFAEVQRKRDALSALEERLVDMEQIRMQKDREFARLQRHLMELLEEQKLELENLREKGIELETATATSAAAAAATAAKAREHEARSHAMFESTEELMKFQFMSMSLSYFSSLNMLKNLRDINADTTAAAITTTAESAATAAAAAAAANITPVSAALAKQKSDGNAVSNLLATVAQRKQQELAQQKREEEEALAPGRQQPLPAELRAWTVDDVGRWLDSLSLPQYKTAFKEGAVDGEFLIELSAEDLAEVLGVSHKLHVRKLLTARNKLLPLTSAERAQLDAVNHEANAARARGRGQEAAPDSDVSLDPETVFSQARNGRMKRLVESLDAGFPVDSEDGKGNTLLLLACQNVNQRMVELLVTRRANVNHRNAQGNTPLHFAMAYDGEGVLGEYLIAHGADDTIENNSGLTPYDGLTAD